MTKLEVRLLSRIDSEREERIKDSLRSDNHVKLTLTEHAEKRGKERIDLFQQHSNPREKLVEDIESCGIYEAGEDRYRLNFPRHGATLITDMSFTAVTVLENKERKTGDAES